MNVKSIYFVYTALFVGQCYTMRRVHIKVHNKA